MNAARISSGPLDVLAGYIGRELNSSGRVQSSVAHLSRWFAHVEIEVRLFVAFGALLSPQNQQKRRKLRKDNLHPVDLRVTSRTESDHQMQQRLPRFPTL